MPNVSHTILLASFLLTWFRNSTAAHPQRAILKGDLVTTEDHFPLLTTRKGRGTGASYGGLMVI